VTSEELVLDTDVASRMLVNALPQPARQLVEPARTAITFITAGELYRGAEHAQWGDRRRAALVEWLRGHRLIPARMGVARRWGEMTGELLRTGRPLPINDSWIAACCLHHELPLLTYNPTEFEGIAGLRVLTPSSK
jgi:predicted nucleic acid-binding protein